MPKINGSVCSQQAPEEPFGVQVPWGVPIVLASTGSHLWVALRHDSTPVEFVWSHDTVVDPSRQDQPAQVASATCFHLSLEGSYWALELMPGRVGSATGLRATEARRAPGTLPAAHRKPTRQ